MNFFLLYESFCILWRYTLLNFWDILGRFSFDLNKVINIVDYIYGWDAIYIFCHENQNLCELMHEVDDTILIAWRSRRHVGGSSLGWS